MTKHRCQLSANSQAGKFLYSPQLSHLSEDFITSAASLVNVTEQSQPPDIIVGAAKFLRARDTKHSIIVTWSISLWMMYRLIDVIFSHHLCIFK